MNNIKSSKLDFNIDTAKLTGFDLLVGGFPCQPFSVAGKRKSFEDDRGDLFFELARILKDKRPPQRS
jgi:DNA (cytosine-5)-methyltransferase 1